MRQGFELITSETRVSSHNHQTRAYAPIRSYSRQGVFVLFSLLALLYETVQLFSTETSY